MTPEQNGLLKIAKWKNFTQQHKRDTVQLANRYACGKTLNQEPTSSAQGIVSIEPLLWTRPGDKTS